MKLVALGSIQSKFIYFVSIFSTFLWMSLPLFSQTVFFLDEFIHSHSSSNNKKIDLKLPEVQSNKIKPGDIVEVRSILCDFLDLSYELEHINDIQRRVVSPAMNRRKSYYTSTMSVYIGEKFFLRAGLYINGWNDPHVDQKIYDAFLKRSISDIYYIGGYAPAIGLERNFNIKSKKNKRSGAVGFIYGLDPGVNNPGFTGVPNLNNQQIKFTTKVTF